MTEQKINSTRSASRWVLAGVGVASFIGMLVLAFAPSTYFQPVSSGGESAGYTTVCSSLVSAGWPRDGVTVDDRIVAGGIMSTDTSEPPYDICHSRRALASAGIGFLAVPASALLYLAASKRRNP